MGLSFASHLDVAPVDDRGLVAVGEDRSELFAGTAYARLGRLVNGLRDEAELIAACDGCEREIVTAALTELRRNGVLVEGATRAETNPEASWWSSLSVSPEVAATRLGQARIRVQALDGVEAGPTLAALVAAGMTVGDDAGWTIVLTHDYLDSALAEINERALAVNRSWMLAAPRAAMTLIGPVFVPDGGPCWECLAQRMRRHQAVRHRLWELTGQPPPTHRSPHPPGWSLGPALIATEAMRWVAGARAGVDALLLSFDLRKWETGRHHVTWRPQCPACGEAEASLARPAAPIPIRRRPQGPGLGSTLRSAAPETTLERFKHHVSPVCGAVAGLARHPGPESFHVYSAGGPTAHVHGDPTGWARVTGMLSGGKGTSDVLARSSAVCEALERYSSEYFGDESRRQETLAELGDAAIHPNEYMRFSDTQYCERERWNAEAQSFRTYVPEPFDAYEMIDWTPAWSLTTERERLLPTALCYYGARVPGHRACVAESNGNAAGNTLEEAILHGLLELIERDHVALWWYNRLASPGVNLDTVDDAWLQRIRRHVADQGRDLWALDLTADLGIPVAAALVSAADGSGVSMGLGAHLDLGQAVTRAVTELVQLGLGAASGGLGTGLAPDLAVDEALFLRPDPELPLAQSCADVTFSGDVTAGLETCLGAIEGAGIEVLVLDQTRPDIGLPVAKVVAPGLRHFWPRFGPGRLFDVPVALGRLDRQREESELNPRPPVA